MPTPAPGKQQSHSLPTLQTPAVWLILALLTAAACQRLNAQPSASPQEQPAAGRHASYTIRSFQLEQPPPSEPGHRAKLILSDKCPAPVAWLFFWDEKTFEPEKHWNREADQERCPKCHPQYELHFPIKALPAIIEKLRRAGTKAKLTFQNDRWSIEE